MKHGGTVSFKCVIELNFIRISSFTQTRKDNLVYRWTSLYARDRDSKNRLTYNEFAY